MENLKNFKELMFLKNFSEKTIKGYTSIITNVSNLLGKNSESITEEDLRSYLLGKMNYSSSSRMAVINAFKCYYRLCFDRDFNNKILPRPKVEQKQPDILSTEEMQLIIDSFTNLKHKAIVSLMYSCAMRVGEVINLKIKDLDTKNDRRNIRIY